MKDIQNALAIHIISFYKHITWTKRRESHYRKITAQSIFFKIGKEIRFFIDFIMIK